MPLEKLQLLLLHTENIVVYSVMMDQCLHSRIFMRELESLIPGDSILSINGANPVIINAYATLHML